MRQKKRATEAAQTHHKDNTSFSENQLQRVKDSFCECPKTMRQVAIELSEERSNICWYSGMLRANNQIIVHHRGRCDFTGLMVNYYTTDPRHLKKFPVQMSLFDEEGGCYE
ncbi:MAG: hypothetical protein LBV72_07050 [Tannerella sp.]|jgi:hypothetical protein|nr:hypothetical protein [Tannerella sp.]